MGCLAHTDPIFETPMNKHSGSTHSSEFIDLLLQQLSGEMGEIAMATNYLAQATSDNHPKRRRVLTSIAKRKIRHADILGTILISISESQGSQPDTPKKDKIGEILEKNGISSTPYRSLFAIFTSLTQLPEQVRRYSGKPKEYLIANIQAEDQQIFTYQRLIALTNNHNFITALKLAQRQQISHRDELVSLLAETER